MLGCHRRIRSGDGARPLTVPHGSFGIRRHSSLMLARAQPCSAQSAFPALKRASSAAVRPGSGSPILRGGPVTDALAHAAKSRTMGSLIRGLRTVKLAPFSPRHRHCPAPGCPVVSPLLRVENPSAQTSVIQTIIATRDRAQCLPHSSRSGQDRP